MVLGRAAVVFVALLVAVAPSHRVDPLTGMTFVLVPSGFFRMGTPAGEAGREAQEQIHDVTIGRAFYLAVHEMTQAEWNTVTGERLSAHRSCDACPVERITFHDVERML